MILSTEILPGLLETADYMQINSRYKIKVSKTEIFWWNVTLNNTKVKIKESGTFTVHQKPSFARIFKE